jgi:hypothetical protein
VKVEKVSGENQVIYFDGWRHLAASIQAFRTTCELSTQFARINQVFWDTAPIESFARRIVKDLLVFGADNRHQLPIPVTELIDSFKLRFSKLESQTWNGNLTQSVSIEILSLETEISYLLADSEQHLRVLSERAFQHLQRSISADPEIREKWLRAFEIGEVACERLGSLHLLSFGIFGFKVDGVGARTDLLLPERPIGREEAAFSEGLVLTEWKLARKASDAAKQFQNAMHQAEQYVDGVLAGVELRRYRYLVVVSKQQLAVPPDGKRDGVVYRNINIAVDPETPSRS